ncbi:MAG: Rpn family recombination-promoting nuclease/putative transposase [Candidatus Parabeggiatoa sp.]|nr:Rpn family recombination-promoting nuclease/putative transposase [Candidatus Parabeggiatoa sp.]
MGNVFLLPSIPLETVNSSFVTNTLRERHDDIIWRVRLEKKWLYAKIERRFD